MPESADLDAVLRSVGTSLGTAEWHLVTQQQFAELAEATDAHEWIHLDEHRAARESSFGQAIAHGYLTLTLDVQDCFPPDRVTTAARACGLLLRRLSVRFS